MTDPTNHPQRAEETREQVAKKYGYNDFEYLLKNFWSRERYISEAMHTHTEDWLKYFAERVKAAIVGYDLNVEDRFVGLTPHDCKAVDSLLSEVTAKMKEGSK